MVGYGSTILRWNGAQWQPQPNPGIFNNHLKAIWKTSKTNIWTVGERSAIYHFDGTTRAKTTPSMPSNFMHIFGFDANHVWPVGDYGVALSWDGTAWSTMPDASFYDSLYVLWGTSPNNLYTAGSNGTLLKWDGGSWTKIPTGTTQTLFGLWGTSAGDFRIAGTGGAILRWKE